MSWINRITNKIKTRLDIDLSDTSNDEKIHEYVEESLREIVIYTNSNNYDIMYDSTLINCVVASWRKQGVEGIKSRTIGGVTDNYGSSDETDIYITKLQQKIRPCGYVYSLNRFNFPQGE